MPRLLAAILLLPYPRTLRATYRDDLAASLEHGWRVACAERPVARSWRPGAVSPSAILRAE